MGESMLDVVRDALAQGRGLVLLDGLDEVKEVGRRRTTIDQTVNFFSIHRRTGNKFLLTSRIVGYRQVRLDPHDRGNLVGFRVVVSPFSSDV